MILSHTDESYANQAEKSEARRRPLYVCRAMHNSVWVAGTQKDKERVCTVTMYGSVQSYDKYELLENIDGAARIAWIRLDKYLQPHVGAVYVDNKMLVARHMVPKDKKEPRYTHYIGTLSSENFGNIIYVNEVSSLRNRESYRTKYLNNKISIILRIDENVSKRPREMLRANKSSSF